MVIKLTEKEEKARSMLYLPLDNLKNSMEIQDRIIEQKDYVELFKIGKGTFTRCGLQSLILSRNYNVEAFLDLKYFDIPNTVMDAAEAATEHEVNMFNVHALGGLEMMKAAVEGVRKASEEYGKRKPKILGVTILTSIDQKIMNEQLRIPGTVQDQVLHLARLSYEAGLDGIVCSAADLYAVKDKLPENFMYVTPGIQGTKTPAGADQKRVFSPGNAIKAGSSILVVGRAITSPKTSEERQQAAYEILQDMAQYL